ncbi:MAG: hypothetical protein GWP04_05190 [Gammaproteobacteria bacterium]|nr:hypothetical protein [Gammaproteobacteria bacterium]
MARRFKIKWWLPVLGGCVAIILLSGLTRAPTSRSFCGSCHETAATSAAVSVHGQVPCLACHTRPGLLGTVEYLPTLARELAAKATGLNLAQGVLTPEACVTCHELGEIEHHPEAEADCATCHGDTTHLEAAIESGPHPDQFTFTHGAAALDAPDECASCHDTPMFCTACHVRVEIPHPDDWGTTHGTVQQAVGADACELCHQPSYCAGCHGTDIPHADSWLSLHYRSVDTVNTAACATCHDRRECDACHARHAVHREQRLFDMEDTP